LPCTREGDTPEAPGAQIQCAERLDYMRDLAALPEFQRFPGM